MGATATTRLPPCRLVGGGNRKSPKGRRLPPLSITTERTQSVRDRVDRIVTAFIFKRGQLETLAVTGFSDFVTTLTALNINLSQVHTRAHARKKNSRRTRSTRSMRSEHSETPVVTGFYSDRVTQLMRSTMRSRNEKPPEGGFSSDFWSEIGRTEFVVSDRRNDESDIPLSLTVLGNLSHSVGLRV